MKDAKHTITSAAGGGSSEAPGCLSALGEIVRGFFAVVLIGGLGAVVIGSLFGPEIPQPPPAPQPRVAIFERANDGPASTALSIVLGGGDYDISYESAGDLATAMSRYPGQSVFLADFESGTRYGNLKQAHVILLKGSLKLSVGSISGDKSLYANIVSRGKDVNAYFNFSTSPRGPPDIPIERTKKKVVVIGELAVVSISGSFQQSTRDISILDLNPSQGEESAYIEARQRYQEAIKTFDAEQQSRDQHQRKAPRR